MDSQDKDDQQKTLKEKMSLDLESTHLEEHSICQCPTTKISWLQTSKWKSFGKTALRYLRSQLRIATTQELSIKVAQQQLATAEAWWVVITSSQIILNQIKSN